MDDAVLELVLERLDTVPLAAKPAALLLASAIHTKVKSSLIMWLSCGNTL